MADRDTDLDIRTIYRDDGTPVRRVVLPEPGTVRTDTPVPDHVRVVREALTLFAEAADKPLAYLAHSPRLLAEYLIRARDALPALDAIEAEMGRLRDVHSDVHSMAMTNGRMIIDRERSRAETAEARLAGAEAALRCIRDDPYRDMKNREIAAAVLAQSPAGDAPAQVREASYVHMLDLEGLFAKPLHATGSSPVDATAPTEERPRLAEAEAALREVDGVAFGSNGLPAFKRLFRIREVVRAALAKEATDG